MQNSMLRKIKCHRKKSPSKHDLIEAFYGKNFCSVHYPTNHICFHTLQVHLKGNPPNLGKRPLIQLPINMKPGTKVLLPSKVLVSFSHIKLLGVKAVF